jgi:hypothetical protein
LGWLLGLSTLRTTAVSQALFYRASGAEQPL